MPIAFMLGVEDVLVSSTDPAKYRVRRGTEKLISWLKSKGNVYLNTRIPLQSNAGGLTLDCQALLAGLGRISGIKRWSFTEMNHRHVMNSGFMTDPRMNIQKTAGYSQLVDRGEVVVHVDVPPNADERMDLESCGATIVEVPPWFVGSREIFDAFGHKDPWSQSSDPTYTMVCKHLVEKCVSLNQFLVVDGHGRHEYVPTSDPGRVAAIVKELFQEADQAGIVDHDDASDTRARFLKKIWFAGSDVPGEADFIFKDIGDEMIAKIREKIPETALEDAASLDWNPQEIRKAKNEPGRDFVESPFGGFPIGEPPQE